MLWGEYDLHGEYFTPDSFLGFTDGAGAPVLLEHGLVIREGLEEYARVVLGRLETRRDERGLWGTVTLDANDPLHQVLYQLAMEGCLGWSPASTRQLMKFEGDWVERFVLVEASLTANPTQPLAQVWPIEPGGVGEL